MPRTCASVAHLCSSCIALIEGPTLYSHRFSSRMLCFVVNGLQKGPTLCFQRFSSCFLCFAGVWPLCCNGLQKGPTLCFQRFSSCILCFAGVVFLMGALIARSMFYRRDRLCAFNDFPLGSAPTCRVHVQVWLICVALVL